MSAAVVDARRQLALATLERTLGLYRYRLSSEKHVQDGIAQVLEQHGYRAEREKIAGADRFDFYLPTERIVIEVKVDGSLPEALRQAERYCAQADVDAVVIASTKRWRTVAPLEFRGAAVVVVPLAGRGAF